MTATVRGFDDPARHALDRAARALFDVHGYAGTHISAIAREAGVSISTFYSRYIQGSSLARHDGNGATERIRPGSAP